jgi:hypothetical protein
MSKLFNSKSWLTLEDACSYLTKMVEETVSMADLLQLVLDHEIKISANFVNSTKVAHGKLGMLDKASGKIVGEFRSFLRLGERDTNHKSIETMIFNIFTTIEEFETVLGDMGHPLEYIKMLFQGFSKESHGYNLIFIPSVHWGGTYLNSEQLTSKYDVVTIDGVYDLVMIGSERHYIENKFQQATNGVEVTRIDLKGTFVENPDPKHREILQLQEKSANDENHYPAKQLPNDLTLVIRTEELTRFIKTLPESTPNSQKIKPRTPENSLLESLGIMGLILSEGKNNLKRGGKPNASQISQAVEIKASKLNIELEKISNLQRDITTGLNLLDSKTSNK